MLLKNLVLTGIVSGALCAALWEDAAAEGTDPRTKSELWCRDTILMFAYPGRPLGEFWTSDNLRRVVAYCDEKGQPTDFFFDGFLILGFGLPENRHLLPITDCKPALKKDWDSALENYTEAAARVSETFGEVSQKLGDPARRAKIILALPYPDFRNHAFGPVNGQLLDLSIPSARFRLVQWYIDAAVERWQTLAAQGRTAHARLVGFYWGHENISALTRKAGYDDFALVKQVGDYVRSKGLLMHWIPGVACVGPEHTRLGLDCVTQQVNYQNPDKRGRPLTIFDDNTLHARRLGLQGVEMTPCARESPNNPRIRSWHQAWLANFEAALRLNWKQFDCITYFHAGDLPAIAADPKTRAYYDDLYKWVKGTLTYRDVEALCDDLAAQLQAEGVLSDNCVKKMAEMNRLLVEIPVIEKLRLMERPDYEKHATTLSDKGY